MRRWMKLIFWFCEFTNKFISALFMTARNTSTNNIIPRVYEVWLYEAFRSGSEDSGCWM